MFNICNCFHTGSISGHNCYLLVNTICTIKLVLIVVVFVVTLAKFYKTWVIYLLKEIALEHFYNQPYDYGLKTTTTKSKQKQKKCLPFENWQIDCVCFSVAFL